MTTLDYIVEGALPAAFALLPERMDTPAARALVIAICLQESRFAYRRQIGGPARGFPQFESSGVYGVLKHSASRPHAEAALEALAYTPEQCYDAIADNDVLALVMARLLLWTHPAALPSRGDTEYAWDYYVACWRPGKPHRNTWDSLYGRAWEIVTEP